MQANIKMYLNMFSVILLMNVMLINCLKKDVNNVFGNRKSINTPQKIEYDDVNNRNEFKSYDKMFKSKRIEAFEDGYYERIEKEPYSEFIDVNIMVNEGDKVVLPCITPNSLDTFVSETTSVDIRNPTGERLVRCLYSDIRTCDMELDGEKYDYVDEEIVSVEVKEMGNYECILSGSRGCTINGVYCLCRNYNLHIRIAIKDIAEYPPPGISSGPGSIYKQNGSTIPCGRSFTSYEPSERDDEVIQGTVETVTSIYRNKRASPNQEDLIGTCTINAMKRTNCSRDGISISFPSDDGKGEEFEFTVTENEDNAVGSYLCETKISNPKTGEDMCAEKTKHLGVETINMWQCKNIISRHYETIHRSMGSLMISRTSTANENQTGAIEHEFVVWTDNKEDNIECVVQVGNKIWKEYSEIVPTEASGDAFLRCCVNKKGCKEIEIWDGENQEGFSWIVFPLVWMENLQDSVKLMRVKAKSPGSGTLFGLCGIRKRSANYNITLINGIASGSVIIVATGMVTVALMWGRRKNKALLTEVSLVKVQLKSRSNSTASINSIVKTNELLWPNPPAAQCGGADSGC